MRKLFTFFSVLLATTALWAYNFQSGNLYYNITSDSTVAVTYQEYNSSSNYASIYTVTVPETITYDGTTYSVTSIGQYAFYDCSSLTSVTIPNSVTSIERWAFSGCSSLTSITIPNSVTSIGSNAFYGCSSLTSITIPESVTYIGGDAFSYCRSLTAITIPESVTDIGSGAFESCSSLTSVVWNAKKCGNRNSYNDGYTHFYFEIEFADSTSYSYEEIDEFVKHFHLDEGNIINDSPFNGCDAIKSFSFGENVEFIPDGLCYGLDSITSITIPKSVWIIGERSFGSCGSLDTIYCYSEDFPVIRLTYLDVVVNMEMIFSYDADAPYIYDNTILYVPCQLLDAYKSQDEYSIRFPNIQCLEEETPSQPQDQPTEGIGVFSIGEGKTVTFSPGNLQYTQSTDTWSFARVQYEVIGTNNVIGGSVSSHALGKEKDGTELADKIDLFGWSTSANNFGVTTSTKNNDYSGSFVDWGTNKIGNDAPNTWRTLTNEEWDYLLNNRKNASSLCGIAQVKDVNGLIILPDNWICPADITFKSGFTGGSYSGVLFYGYQTFSVNQWSKLEAAGAIFLPAAGGRHSNSVYNVQYSGHYWSATECNNNQTYYTHFDHSEVIMNNFYRYTGKSVRLVKDINSTTPEPPIEPQDTTIYHPVYSVTICEYDLPFNWHVAGHTMICETAGTYTHEEIVEEENYIYHYIHTLELQVIAPPLPDTIVVEAYDSFEWHGIVYTESGTYLYEEWCYQEILQLTIIDTPTPPEPDHSTEGIGVFSVGEGKIVTFSRGNLQYTQSTQTWSFAENQYDYLGTANVSNGALADKIDLFGWSASNTTAPFGVSTSTDWENGYSGSFIDWGTNKIGNDAPNTWRTLTYDEWYYLRYNRTNADNLVGVAQVNGVNGLILLPDNWTCPAGVTFKSGFHSSNGVEYYAAYQTFTADQWSKFEAAGAVFLPAAGDRGGSNLGIVQRGGFYWSATEHYSYYADYLYFYSDEARMFYSGYRHGGQSVRLVKDVNSTTPEPPVEPETEWITIYIDTVICEYDLPFNWHVGDHTMILCETAGTYTHEEIVEDENYIYHYIFTLELTVIPFSSDTIVVEAYDSYEWHGKVYTESGTYIYENFCSIEVLELTIIDTPTPPEPPVEPEGPCSNIQELDWKNGLRLSDFSAKTWYKMYVGDVKGSNFEVRWINDEPCVATWTTAYLSECLNTTDWSEIEWESLVTRTDTCALGLDTTRTVSSSFFDKYSQIGDYIYVYVGSKVLDCDSEPQDTTIYIYYTEDATICEGETYIWWMGKEYTETGTYTYAYEEIVGEDDYIYHYHHIFTLDLTVMASETVVLVEEAYDSYEWHGVVYTESGVYTYRDPYNPCVIEELDLTIIDTPTPPSEPQDTTIYHPVDITICENDLPYTFTGRESAIELTEAGTYTYEEIVEDENYIYHYIYTLDLTVMASKTVVLVEEAYDSYEWHGVVYTESGTYIYEEYCYQEILHLTIIPSEEKEYLYIYLNELICDGYEYRDPITGIYHLISSFFPYSLTWSDTITGTEVDTIYTFNITPIVNPEPLTEDMLYAIGAVPKLVAGEKVDIAGTTELIMAYYQKHDKNDIADVIGVEWVAGHDVVLDAEQTTHTMVLEVWADCDYIIPMEFTFPVSKKDSEPQDTTIYIYYTEDVTICEGETLTWRGMECTETGTYTYAYEEIVEEDDYIYIYHNIYTLHLMVLPPTLDMYEVTAYDSYEWHGVVYTESGVYTYRDPYNPCVIEELHLTIIDTPSEIQYDIYYADTICEGEIYVWMGMRFTETGTYTYTYEEIVEDKNYIYLHILYLTVLPYETIEYEVEAYDSYVWHDTVYTESGTYTYQYECTTEILHLTIIDTPSQPQDTTIYHPVDSVTICHYDLPYFWHGNTYGQGGTYRVTEIVEEDYTVYHHIYTLELTVLLFSVDTIVVEAYDSYEWHGKVYTESGVYQYWMDLCEMEELHLTIVAEPTDLTNPSTEQDTIHKLLRDGQLYIYHNGSAYTIMGQKVSENF